jgi:hypothetical protein
VSESSAERARGVALFNGVWELIESRADDDRMVSMAHASRFHWGEAPECTDANRARGEWLLSRVYWLVGRPEPALWHARRCLEWCQRGGGVEDWDLAYAHEALARAGALAGDPGAGAWRSRAREFGDAIADPEDREHFDQDFATLVE